MDNFIQLEKKIRSSDKFTELVKSMNFKDYKVIDDDVWIYFNPIECDVPDSGWKGHLSVQSKDIEDVFLISSQILSIENCAFKVARSRQVYEMLSDTHASVTEANKFMTFYPKNVEEFKLIVFKLDKALQRYSAPKIFTDFQLPKNSCVQFRYGAFKKMTCRDKEHNKIIDLVRLPTGKLIPDDRTKSFHMLPGTSWPFKANKYKDKKVYCPELNKYRFSEILSRKNKGGVYKGITINDVPIVMKTANELVGSNPKKLSAKQLLNNEIKYMKVLNKSPYIPELIEIFSQGKTLVEIMRFISGPQLINIKIEDKEKVIRSLIKTVYSLHKQGIIIGDLTNTNFIYSNQKCYLVDLEYMASVNTPQKREAQTRFYLPDYKKEGYETQIEDVYSLAVTVITIIFNRVPKYHANNLFDGAVCLMRQLVIAEKLNPEEMKIINLAKYLLNIILSNDEYDPEQLNTFDNCKKYSLENFSKKEKISLLKNTIERKVLPIETKYSEYGLAKHMKNITNFGTMTSPISIQSGSVGINVFKGNSINLNNYKWRSIVAGLTSLKKYEYYDSYLFGYTGVLWEAGNNFLRNEITKNQLKEVVTAFLSMEKNCNNHKIDFALGISGKLYTAIRTLICQNNENLFSYSKKMGERLYMKLKKVHVIESNNFNQINFAHGLAGEAYSLLVSGLYFKKYNFQNKALEILNEIDQFMMKNLNRIKLLGTDTLEYSWCEGASGIGIALIRAVRLTNNSFAARSLNDIYKFCIHGYIELESNICHGRNSVIDFLNDYNQVVKSTKLKNDINMLIEFDLVSSYDESRSVLDFFDETGFTNCWDYGVGQIGSICSDLHALNGENRDFYLTDEQEHELSKNLIMKGN